MQVDEKWSFVAKKERHCDATDSGDDGRGDCWDHTAIDPESRLLLSVIPGERTAARAAQLIGEVHQRTGGRTDLLLTSDAYAPYQDAVRAVYGQRTPAARSAAAVTFPGDFCYATVRKQRTQGRVVAVVRAVVYGTWGLLARLLERSTVSTTINTAFVERNNGTDRRRNSRKQRKTYGFSKDRVVHEAVTYFVSYSYNFCWPVRTLRVKNAGDHWERRTPAMAAGLTDHVWTLREWLTCPARLC